MLADHENAGNVGCWSSLSSKAVGFWRKVKKTGSDDPRRVIHSFKVGLGLTLISTFYYVNAIFDDLGHSAMWAVLTVVLVMEFTVGAAILKGLNRACATLLAGALGVGAHYLAILFGKKWEPVVLGLLVFLVALVATFARFIPELKSRYDYGAMIFILTFCLVTVSSYRKEEVVVLAKERVFTIAIGVAISFFTSIVVFPVWAGDDIHKLAVGNIEKLASFLQGFEEALAGKNSFSQSHKSVLNSKAAEDNLSSLARWEPPHGRFGFRHPWDQYLKIGDQSRRCAHLMEALNTYLASKQVQLHEKLTGVCIELSMESGKALSELALAFRSMTMPSAAIKDHMTAASMASEQLMSLLEDHTDLKEVLHAASIVSMLAETVGCTREIVASIEELARLAGFRSS